MTRPTGDRAGRGLPPRLDPRAGRARPWEHEPPQVRYAHSGRRRLVRGTRIVAAVVSFLVLAGTGYGWAQYRSFASNVRHIDAIGASGPDKDGAAQNILLVGDDSRPANASPEVLAQLSTQQDGGSVNTDTMMLLHIPAGGGQPTVISFPRDSWVDIPGFGHNKLNAAFALGSLNGGGDAGGMKLLIKVIQGMTGLSIDHFVKVSLLGFYDIAQALGPIQVCLNQAVNDPFSGVNLPAGPSTLNAKQALSFVRQRHGLPRGDLDREVRQQYFLSTELRKVTSTGVLLNPGKLNQLLTAVSNALETDPNLDLLQFATQFKNISAGSVRFATIPITGTPTIQDDNGNDVSIVAVDFTALPAFISQVVGPPGPYASASAADPASTSVQVVNGTGTAGLAASTATALKGLGFLISGTGNAASTSLTTVSYPAGKEAQAKALAQKIPGVTVVESSQVQEVTLTLGTDGLRPAATPSSTGSGSGSSAPSSAPSSGSSAGSSPASQSPAKSFAAGSCIN